MLAQNGTCNSMGPWSGNFFFEQRARSTDWTIVCCAVQCFAVQAPVSHLLRSFHGVLMCRKLSPSRRVQTLDGGAFSPDQKRNFTERKLGELYERPNGEGVYRD